nr:MAG TPA: hypothetical protein [Caudoviricetes sp.]
MTEGGAVSPVFPTTTPPRDRSRTQGGLTTGPLNGNIAHVRSVNRSERKRT